MADLSSSDTIDAALVARQWGELVERLEDLWDHHGSEELQGLYFALDLAQDREAEWGRLAGQEDD